MTVEGFDIKTGKTTWSVAMGAEMSLVGGKVRPPIAGPSQVVLQPSIVLGNPQTVGVHPSKRRTAERHAGLASASVVADRPSFIFGHALPPLVEGAEPDAAFAVPRLAGLPKQGKCFGVVFRRDPPTRPRMRA